MSNKIVGGKPVSLDDLIKAADFYMKLSKEAFLNSEARKKAKDRLDDLLNAIHAYTEDLI